MKTNQLDIRLREGVLLSIYSDQLNLVMEEDAAEYGESPWQLYEGRTYEYELLDEAHKPIEWHLKRNDAILCENARYHYRGQIRTGNYVGNLELVAVCDATGLEVPVRLEIQSVKATYRRDYRQMLSDITQYYTELVMQQGAPVTQKFEVDYDAPQETLYQKFAFVKSIVESEQFDEAMRKIMANPVRNWAETTREVRMENVHRLSRNNLRQIVTRHDRVSLPRPLYGLDSLPRSLTVVSKKDSLNTSENQFVKFVLTTFYAFCSDIATKRNASEVLRQESHAVCERLAAYRNALFFRDVANPTQLNLGSPVLQRKEGYREVLQAWLMFDLAAKLTWKGGDNVYEAGKKNVAALYEYWLFFKLLEVVSDLFHIDPVEKEKLVMKDRDQLNLDLRQGRMKMIAGSYNDEGRLLNIRLYYNRTFGMQEDMHRAGSWTMVMRPDYTLSLWPGSISEEEAENEELIVHIHFDAKYRVNRIFDQHEMTEEEAEQLEYDEERLKEKSEQELGIYKRVDLLKMHAYKDAIRRTSGAYVLYPGTEKKVQQGFHEIIPGLGAFCIAPGHEEDQLPALRDFILQVKEHLYNRTSQREKMALHAYETYREVPKELNVTLPEAVGENRDFQADSTYVLLGYVRNQQHLDWILKHGLYNARAGKRGGSVSLDKEKAGAQYLLLHMDSGECHFVKLSGKGPQILTFQSLVGMDYPYRRQNDNRPDEEILAEQQGNIYLAYHIKSTLEPEYQQYSWDFHDFAPEYQKHRYQLQSLTLSELMQVAKKGEENNLMP